MPKNKLSQELELVNGEICGERGLFTFFTNDTDSNIGF